MTIKHLVVLGLYCFLLSGCINLPDHVVAELDAPTNGQVNHFAPPVKAAEKHDEIKK